MKAATKRQLAVKRRTLVCKVELYGLTIDDIQFLQELHAREKATAAAKERSENKKPVSA